jgi:dTDP-4-dehydrorhamnose 3,5-epimerase-like enzyme
MSLIEFTPKGDSRGWLIALENLKEVPFEIKRVYYIYGTELGVRRGMHAHRDLQQVAICVCGACTFLLDDGRDRRSIRLDRPDRGLHIRSMVWREMESFTPDCVLLVLANRLYDENDYIRAYDQFKNAACSV